MLPFEPRPVQTTTARGNTPSRAGCMKLLGVGTSAPMNWTYWLAGAIALAFIAALMVYAAMRDRGRGEEVVDDLPERTHQNPHHDGREG